MTRLTVFLSVLTGFILVLALFAYKGLPVDNAKFDYAKTKEAFDTKSEAILSEICMIKCCSFEC
jgi:hypothetical protein